jgi:hypothetical protein
MSVSATTGKPQEKEFFNTCLYLRAWLQNIERRYLQIQNFLEIPSLSMQAPTGQAKHKQ